MSASIFTIANNKGGVGKTTTAVNLAERFAHDGYRVLLIDTDAQGHCATSFGLEPVGGLYRFLIDKEDLLKVVAQPRSGLPLDLLPSDKSTEKIPYKLMDMVSEGTLLAPGFALADALEDYLKDYQIIIVDCPPSINLLHTMALMTANYAVIPTLPEYLSGDGVMSIIKAIRALEKFRDVTPPDIIGIIPFQYERNRLELRYTVEELVKVIGPSLVMPPIPRDVRAKEATRCGRTIFEYSPDSPAAIGYEIPVRFDGQETSARNSLGRVGGYLHIYEIVKAIYFLRKKGS